MKKYFLLTVFTLVATLWANAQNLDKMQWFNEPESYTIRNGKLEMDVPAQTDYWRIAHYGFTVDDGPFLYTTVGGEFEAKIKVGGDYKVRFDQAGMMIRKDPSDWSVIELKEPIPFLWLKAVRRLDAIELYYSFDDKEYKMMRTLWMQDNCPLMVGPVAACPDGQGFKAVFSHFKVKHLPDQRRVEWLRNNQ